MSERLDITPETTVSAIAAQYPAALRMLEALGIDYCCGGKLPLAEAAAKAGMPVATVIAVLRTSNAQAASAGVGERDWQTAPLDELMDHILQTHHVYMDNEMPRLETMLATVARVHGPSHGDVLYPLAEKYAAVKTELTTHLKKEEEVTFPAIARMLHDNCDEEAITTIVELENEHEAAGAILHEIHELTNGYTLPDRVCNTYRALYAGLQAMENDIHQHIHLENNILFPRALALFRTCEHAA